MACDNCGNNLDIKSDDVKINKQELLKYSFYDEQHNLNVVINADKIKTIFNADNILFEEDAYSISD